MKTQPFLMHALSPLHAGTGQAVDIIDLPIARMRSTGIPIVPGSSVKGVLRDARRNGSVRPDELFAVFGPETGSASENAGALIVGDARLLALPVRSFRGTFAFTTSPLLFELARRDLPEKAGPSARVPAPAPFSALVADTSRDGSLNVHDDRHVYLEDLDLPVEASEEVKSWAGFLGSLLFPDNPAFLARRLVVVDDETMTFLWETATQVDTRVRIDPHTRVVASKALWVEESLPPETLLVGLMAADRSRRKDVALSPADVLASALPQEEILQFGGKATIGRGRCRLIPVSAS